MVPEFLTKKSLDECACVCYNHKARSVREPCDVSVHAHNPHTRGSPLEREMKIGERRMKKKLCAVLLIVVLLSFAVAAVACNDDEAEGDSSVKLLHADGAVYPDASYYEAEHDKAMILIPGLMASSLHTTEANEFFDANTQVWGVQGFINLVKAASNEENPFRGTALSELIGCDENGIPNTKLRVDDMTDVDCYGAFQGMGYLYRLLSPDYGKQYDIVVWQYDWRETNVGSAEQLELFIEGNGWDEVMFFTHSMGGIVVANYLARSAANREKTELFMPFGAPFFGSMDAINNLFVNTTPGAGGFNLGGATIDIFGLLTDVMSEGENEFTLATLARTLSTVYELLPTQAYNESDHFDSTLSGSTFNSYEKYVGATSSILLSGQPVTMSEFLTYLQGFSWAKKADGTSIAPVANQASYVSSLYVDDGTGKKVFVTELVPTEYMLGIGVNTSIAADINANGEITEIYKSYLGDGTVPAYSASAGHALDDEHVHYVVGIEHGPLANDEKEIPASTTCLQYVPALMKLYIEKTDSELGL